MGSSNSKSSDVDKSASQIPAVEESRPSTEATDVSNSSNQEASKCPMHNEDGSYSWSISQMFKAAAVHGPSGKKPLSEEEQAKSKEPTSKTGTKNESGGCPVKHISPPPATGGCPVKHNSSGSDSGSGTQYPEYNVYSQPIDKENQMPKGVRTQMPTSTQTVEISTERVKSSIPKGGDADRGTTWTYPSPQQFYNALSRKGKLGDETSGEDIESVVALHNNMNEKTWSQVVEWEKQTFDAEATPKLLKFMGRPHDLSPKATLKHYLLGHPLPYDRHDWTVLRENGDTVRYVIDYYYDETRANESEDSAMPSKDDRNATPSLLVDVRPALDGPSEFVSRAVKMPLKLFNNETSFQPLPLRGTPEMAKQVKESMEVWQSIQNARKQELQREEAPTEISPSDAEKIALNFAKVMKECRKQERLVEKCQSQEECSRASLDLTMCMGHILCPVQQKSLTKSLAESDDDKIEAALETLSECVMHHTAERALAKKQHPSAF